MTKTKPGSDEAARMAFREIRHVLRKHKLAGCAFIVSDARAFWVYEFPAWCALTYEQTPEGQRLRLRARRNEFDTDEAANKHAELTAHVVFQMRDLSAATFDAMNKFAIELEDQWGAEHRGFQDINTERDQ